MDRPSHFEGHSQGGTAYEIDLTAAIEVRIAVEVQDVAEVDCQQERFTAVWVVKMEWTDPELKDFCSTFRVLDTAETPREFDGTVVKRRHDEVLVRDSSGDRMVLRPWHILNESQPQWEKHFFPEHTYRNLLGPLRSVTKPVTRLDRCTDAGGVVVHKATYAGTFSERLDLRRFPFDRQLLRIGIVAEGAGVERFCFVPMPIGSSGPPNVHVTEWSVDRYMQESCTLYVLSVKDTVYSSAMQYASAKVLIHLERKAGFYVYNTIMSLFFIVLGSALGCVARLEDAPQRAGLQAIFLLATVAYKNAVKDWAPRKPYFTRLDRHFLKALLLHTFLALESVFLSAACNCQSSYCWGGFGQPSRSSMASCPEGVEDLDGCIWTVVYALWVWDHVRLMYWVRCRNNRLLLPPWLDVYVAAGERQADLPVGLLRLMGVKTKTPPAAAPPEDEGPGGVPVIREARRPRTSDPALLRRGSARVEGARRAERPRPADEGQTPEVPRRLEELLSAVRAVEGSLAPALEALARSRRRRAAAAEESPEGDGEGAKEEPPARARKHELPARQPSTRRASRTGRLEQAPQQRRASSGAAA